MPRTKYLTTKVGRIEIAVSSLASLSKMFRGECRTAKTFAEAIKVSPPTAAARLGNPQEMTLEELITATVNLGYTASLNVQKDGTSIEIKW